ncbi:MAG: relaxase/mobilization nuclease domain-containing protein [Oscillospiraceae bacterium]|nr:relaxase/mobilization nuclease domain-containing protein [Oscillospiraceae bacterium]
MAVVKFIPARRPQSGGGLRGSILYCKRKDKTWDERTRRQLVTGVNCLSNTAFQEFMNTKRLFGKTEGRMYYHLIQSFSPEEVLTAETAHEIALKLAQEFAGFEVLVCTHTDRDHLHSHLIINSVSAENGRKYHSDKDNIQRIRQVHSAAANGRWCGDQRPPCGLKTAG